MELLNEIESAKNIVIVGLGLTGQSCVDFLYRSDRSLTVVDTRVNPPGLTAFQKRYQDVALHAGELPEEIILAADLIVVSPGVDLRSPVFIAAQKAGLPIIGDVEIFALYVDAPVIGITGSNGKSTVTTLVGDIARFAGLKVAVGGNIGEPVLTLLKEHADVYVLELSSFQLESVYSLACEVAVVLNLSMDHMDRYNSFEDYVTAKQRIFSHARYCVVNADDEVVMSLLSDACQKICFSSNCSNDDIYGLEVVNGKTKVCYKGGNVLSLDTLRVPGKHNQVNAVAATAIAQAMGWPIQAIEQALKEFKGLQHRCELILEADGRRWINDSKGTNVGATVAALDGLDGPLVLIAGGDGKGADFSPLCQAMEGKVLQAVLIGQDAAKIAAAIEGKVVYQYAHDMDEAVALAAKSAPAESVILLSPACASLDMYANYQQRGDAFTQAVKEQCA